MTKAASVPDLATRVARTQLTVGVVALAVGVIGFWVARNADFSGGPGAIIFEDLELRTMSYNRLGAVLTIVFGAIGIAASLVRRPMLGLIGGTGFALMAVQPLLQWRTGADNLLAATGRNWSFNLAMALGLLVPAVVARLAGMGAPSTVAPTD